MTLRQIVLKMVYPVIMKFSERYRNGKILVNKQRLQPLQSFYSLHAIKNSGEKISLEGFKGKKVLLVNTASDCGYTAQYNDLQKLYEQYNEILAIVGFPANDFKEQEKGTNEEIAQFCKINFGVTFPIIEKSSVIKGASQNEVFKWLTDKNRNGWNVQQPQWNFSKYLINEKGELMNYFGPAVSPLSDEVKKAIMQ